ncbi:MAG: flagellar biosynthesis protein FlaG [Methylophaga sp.]|nr:MAG: flagellar biosynthesis protein FlaG [Methylophaga sp.]
MEITTNQVNQVNQVSLDEQTPTKASSVESEVVTQEPVEPNKINSATVAAQSERATESLQNAVSQINEYMQKLERSLQFTIDEGSGKEVVTVLDKHTEEVIRQFPSEEMLVIARQIAEHKEDVISLFSSQA